MAAAAVVVTLCVLGIMPNYSVIFLAAAFLPFLARWLCRGRLTVRTPFDIPIAVLLLAGLVGILAASDRSRAWQVYQTLLGWVLLYYSMVNSGKPRLVSVGGLLLAGAIILFISGYVFLQEDTALPFYSQLKDWINPGPAALPEGWLTPPLASSACGVTVAAEAVALMLGGVAVFHGTAKVRIPALVVFSLLVAVLIISPCHATWVVMGAGLVLLLALRSKWSLLLIPLWLWLAYSGLTEWHGGGLGGAIDFVRDGLAYKWNYRWEGILYLLQDHPIFGCGPGMYPAVAPTYNIGGPHAHNAFLQFYCDFGLLGVLALGLAAVVFLRIFCDILRDRSHHPLRGVALGAAVAIVAGVMYSMVESAPACMIAYKVGGYAYAISPLFLILAAVLSTSYLSMNGPTDDSSSRP